MGNKVILPGLLVKLLVLASNFILGASATDPCTTTVMVVHFSSKVDCGEFAELLNVLRKTRLKGMRGLRIVQL
jgi:hypothetical protein